MVAEVSNVRTRIIDVAIQMIETGGESSIRLTKIAHEVGVSEPALYHHFKDRSELVTAAYLAWYKRNLELDDPPENMLAGVTNVEEFFRTLRKALEWSYVDGRAHARSIRVAVLGAAQTNPALRTAINDLNREFLTSAASNIRVAQEKGWIRTDIDPTAVVYWLNGQITGRLVAEMTGGEVDMEAWNEVSFEAIFGMLRTS